MAKDAPPSHKLLRENPIARGGLPVLDLLVREFPKPPKAIDNCHCSWLPTGKILLKMPKAWAQDTEKPNWNCIGSCLPAV